MEKITGNRDLDKLILDKLDVRSTLNFCGINHYTYNLCDEKFWERKSKEIFTPLFLENKRDQSWKNFYLNAIQIPYMDLYLSIIKDLPSVRKTRMSSNALALLLNKLDTLYEKLLNIRPNQLKQKLFDLTGDEYFTVKLYRQYQMYGYFKAQDKRRIIEFLMEEIIESASEDASEDVRNTVITTSRLHDIINEDPNLSILLN